MSDTDTIQGHGDDLQSWAVVPTDPYVDITVVDTDERGVKVVFQAHYVPVDHVAETVSTLKAAL